MFLVVLEPVRYLIPVVLFDKPTCRRLVLFSVLADLAIPD